jgi:hypothetical protein
MQGEDWSKQVSAEAHNLLPAVSQHFGGAFFISRINYKEIKRKLHL